MSLAVARSSVRRLRADPLLYAYVVLAAWAFAPELRRIVDWNTSFTSVSVISIVPLVALIPSVFLLFSRAGKLERGPLVVGWLWFGGFAYAFMLAVASGNAQAGAYAFAGFVLPACFGLYLSTLGISITVLHERVAQAALLVGVPVALYALYQYAFPPPWDLLWIQQVALTGVGTAAPFSFRAFSTLNGPGPLADFLVYVFILNLPRARFSPMWIAALGLIVVGLAVTQVRADWIALVLAALIYVALGPNQLRSLSTVAALALATVLLVANAGFLLGDDRAGQDVQDRFGTLASVTTDRSYIDRREFVGAALATALAQPLGSGLGISGTAAKLGATEQTVVFDNGYIARLTEMGYAGMAAYLAAIGLAFVISFRRLRRFARAGESSQAAVVAAALALQAALVFLDVSGDHHSQLGGLYFWLSFALACAPGKSNVRE